jgi:H+-transporting ATPase
LHPSVVFTLLIVWTSSFYRSVSIVHILEYTLAITIVGVPVGLPAVVTTTMAVGASYLAKKMAIVQKLSAIESLAGVEILCSDKTGYVTRQLLRNRWILSAHWQVYSLKSSMLTLP